VPSSLLSRRDLEFLLYEWLDVEALTKRERYAEHGRDTFDDALALAERLATELYAPHRRRADDEEPHVVDGHVVLPPEVAVAVKAYGESGFVGATIDAEHGGMQLPAVIAEACTAWFQAANAPTASYSMLSTGNAHLLLAQGTPEQIATWAQPVLEGRWTGTMCLSEPHAGSSLSDLTTRAEPQPDGSYRIFGTKMWISGGDHELTDNIVHLVLARVPGAPAGTRGLSLFIVPKVLLDDAGELGERNDVVLAGLNHKMGWRGTTNCVLGFGEGVHTPGGAPGAVGYLVGAEGAGLAGMFHMMNGARIGVGLGATALGYAGYLASLDYARSRPQGRPIAAKDPSSAQVPIVEHADVRRMLLAQKAYVEGGLAFGLWCGRLLDDQVSADDPAERERAGLLLDVLTPIAKSWPSQWCLAANDLAIQVMGGAGYTRDHLVELLYRDNRLNPIHEGTHGIQALDLLGRKVIMQGGAGLRALLRLIGETAARGHAAGGAAATHAVALEAAAARVAATTAQVWSTGDPSLALANATAYLEAVGHVVLAWVWLEQELVAVDRDGSFYAGKRAAAQYFYAHELPKVGPQLDLLDALDRTVLDTDPAWL